MADIVRVAVLGLLALGVIVLYLNFAALRGQVDDLRAEVACLRIERVLGVTTPTPPAARKDLRLATRSTLVVALIGVLTGAAGSWILVG
ncbi:hypothetical protein ACIQCR_24500 [Streptomyces sp. NPDC093249]|uniref:hypothetical protein n=1 Tax=unclassified Streptomyces TaxID=2593676 RepID=UPI00383068C1